ncbi:hypothetical protein [Corynebacterium phoceense]
MHKYSALIAVASLFALSGCSNGVDNVKSAVGPSVESLDEISEIFEDTQDLSCMELDEMIQDMAANIDDPDVNITGATSCFDLLDSDTSAMIFKFEGPIKDMVEATEGGPFAGATIAYGRNWVKGQNECLGRRVAGWDILCVCRPAV